MLRTMRISLVSLVLTAALVGPVGLGFPVGDLNNDFQVNSRDLQIFTEQWLDAPGGSANLNNDGHVDMVDLALLAKDWHEMDSGVVINEIHYDPDIKTDVAGFCLI